MQNVKDQYENFKSATAATLRAIAGKKGYGVNFSAQERLDRPTNPLDEGTNLPLPDEELSNPTLTRGTADAKALRLQHHTALIHQQNAPLDLTARAVFDALEQARVEAIGASQMPGVKDNLNQTLNEKCDRLGYTHLQNREDSNIADALHAYARVHLTGEPVPENAKTLLQKWTPWIEEKLGQDNFENLKSLLENQSEYAAATRELMLKMKLLAADDAGNPTPEDNTEAQGQSAPEDP